MPTTLGFLIVMTDVVVPVVARGAWFGNPENVAACACGPNGERSAMLDSPVIANAITRNSENKCPRVSGGSHERTGMPCIGCTHHTQSTYRRDSCRGNGGVRVDPGAAVLVAVLAGEVHVRLPRPLGRLLCRELHRVLPADYARELTATVQGHTEDRPTQILCTHNTECT